jgi:hypothetical protein
MSRRGQQAPEAPPVDPRVRAQFTAEVFGKLQKKLDQKQQQ